MCAIAEECTKSPDAEPPIDFPRIPFAIRKVYGGKSKFQLKTRIRRDEIPYVNLIRCPYDSTDVTVDGYEGGVYLISCECCKAQWETHQSWMARVSEPDWEIVKAFQEIQNLQTTRD